MWNFIKGVQPPKRKQTSEERKEKDASYEKCRKRNFVTSWKQGRPWLRVETNPDGEEMMFCDYCIKAGTSSDRNSFVKGCASLRLESIKYHEASNTHLFAANKQKNEQNPTEAPALRAQLSLNKLAIDRLKILFMNVYALNLQGRPARDYRWMTDLDVVKGLNVGNVYRTEVKCREFASAIAHVQRINIADHIAKCNFVAVIVDGSMDSASIDNEMIYIQSCYQGKVHTNFIRCCQVERGDAKGIIKAIKRGICTITEWKTFISKVVALGSDGASVMLGKNNGVIALLQSEQPSVIAMHCSGHRLELAYKDSMKKHPLAEKVLTLLTGLYYLYRKSPLNKANLKHAFKCLGLKPLLPTRSGGTRWIGHILRALNNFLFGYPAIRLHLEQVRHEPLDN